MGIDWESILGCDEDNVANEYEKLVNNTCLHVFDCDFDDDELALKGE